MSSNGCLTGIPTIEPTILSPTGLDLSLLDVDAVRAVTRLIDRGFESYLVGGCVRDLLLGRSPKDYDIATEARPPQVKRTFPRNCRIIGRRFKLAHLHFHNNTKILECSTFRRTPQENGENGEADLLITRDNEFGNAEEDAMRRDFTVNALFLDPTRDVIVDHVNGLADIEARVIRTIGDPVVRFREDPVRILRAAKFAGRLGFHVEERTLAAMAETSADLVRAAPPRVLEEILRLLRSGHALDSFQLLRDVGALKHLVPVVGEFLARAGHERRVDFWRLLEALDHHVDGRAANRMPQNGVLLACLMYEPVAAALEQKPNRSASSVAEDLLGPMCADLRLPRRDSGCLKRICGVQHRFEQDEDSRRFRAESFVHSPYFAEALELFELRTTAHEGDRGLVEQWRELAGDAPMPAGHESEHDGDDDGYHEHAGRQPSESHATTEAEHEPGESREPQEPDEPGRRRRRRRRRRRGGERDESGARHASAETAHADDDAPRGDDEDAADDLDEAHGHERREHDHGSRAAASHDAHADPDADADAETDADSEADTDEASRPAEAQDGGERRRRRRRRRRRGGRGNEEGAFPQSHGAAPHGDPLEPEAAGGHEDFEDPDAETFPRDPGSADIASEQDGDADADDGREGGDAPDAAAAAEDRDEGGRRGRRRRGRRGRKRRGDGEPRPADRPSPAERPAERPAEKPTEIARRDDRREDRGGRHKDQRKKGRGHKGGQRGAPRDVDVVPRYRDRRGKVEVLEPPSLDLSAFDVELDPKRVPTFGSIVEGQGKPKRKDPRLSEKVHDEYRPPPPPGSDRGPAPPPPPPADDDDTFGDW